MKYVTDHKITIIRAVTLMLIAGSILTACAPGGPPPRKKFPLTSLDEGGWEGRGPSVTNHRTSFVYADTLITLSGKTADFLLLRLPSRDYDFLLPAIKSKESLLTNWLNYWPKLDRHGVVIDLSDDRGTQRADFQLTCPDADVSIPLILLWDETSADRSGDLIQLMQSLKTIQSRRLTIKDNNN